MEINTFLHDLEKELYQVERDIETIDKVKRLESVLKTYEGPDKVVTSEELAELIKQRPEETKYHSRFKGLNDILDGFREGQLIVIAAPTKMGKTTFAIELTKDLQQYNPLWFPFEETAEELIRKFLERDMKPPHFVTPVILKQRGLNWIEERIVESVVKYDSKIVFIDHLHFIVSFSSDRVDQEIGKTMRELKRMAKQLRVVIVLIAHLKKTRTDEHPSLEDLRDSSFVAQEADTVILLWRETKKRNGEWVISNNVNVSVQANRRTGRTGNIKMVYTPHGGMEERDWAHDGFDETSSSDYF